MKLYNCVWEMFSMTLDDVWKYTGLLSIYVLFAFAVSSSDRQHKNGINNPRGAAFLHESR